MLAEHTRTATLRGRVGWRTRSLTNRACSLFTISNIRAPSPAGAKARTSVTPDTGTPALAQPCKNNARQRTCNDPPAKVPKNPQRSRSWWSLSGSNRRPEACKATALPTELRPRSKRARPNLVGLGRLERPTSPLSGVRSNHLSYRPEPSQKRRSRRHLPYGVRNEIRETKTAMSRLLCEA